MRLTVGCVADSSDKFLAQALRLLQSWRWFAGPYSDAQFHVAVVDAVPPEYRRRFEQHDAMVHVVPRFSDRHPPSNKLRFLELPEVQDADRALLLDCDTVVVQNPDALFRGEDFVAKIADVATVSLKSFEGLFRRFGIPMPRADQTCTVSGESMIPYFNAGVLSFSRRAMATLVPAWLRLNTDLTKHMELLADASNFTEQASLSLALAETNTSFETVGNDLNFPAHFEGQPLDSAFARVDPVIIHYHWLSDAEGYLLPSIYPGVNRRIVEFNSRLRKEGGSWARDNARQEPPSST